MEVNLTFHGSFSLDSVYEKLQCEWCMTSTRAPSGHRRNVSTRRKIWYAMVKAGEERPEPDHREAHIMVEEVIRAGRFEVVDDGGKVRAILGAQNETAGLMLLDGNGQNVAELAVSDEFGGTTLSLYDLRGSLRVSLDLDHEGSPTLGLYDLAGESRVSLGIAEGNTPVFDFTGPYGEARMSFEVDEDGLPSFVLMDGNGNDRASIRVDRKGNPFIEFFDADGRPAPQGEENR